MLNQQQFEDAITLPDVADRNIALTQFIEESKVLKGITPAQIIAIAKMVCAVAEVVCPIINDL